MGNNQDKIMQKEKLIEDLQTINKITTNFLFYKVIGINFEFFDKSEERILNQKFILVKTENEENKRKGGFYISPQEFYEFHNVVFECLPVFYQKSFVKSTTNKEEELCCICDDKKSDIMLECCVS
jgi:hypothetical protein